MGKKANVDEWVDSVELAGKRFGDQTRRRETLDALDRAGIGYRENEAGNVILGIPVQDEGVIGLSVTFIENEETGVGLAMIDTAPIVRYGKGKEADAIATMDAAVENSKCRCARFDRKNVINRDGETVITCSRDVDLLRGSCGDLVMMNLMRLAAIALKAKRSLLAAGNGAQPWETDDGDASFEWEIDYGN